MLRVKVMVVPVMVVGPGVTASQFEPAPCVMVGVMVRLLSQAPLTLTVKVWVEGFAPSSVVKVVLFVSAACTFSATVTRIDGPTGAPLTLSVALIVIVAFEPPACSPLGETDTLVVAEAVRLTVPEEGVVVSQVFALFPPLTVAVQLRALAQAPLAVMVTGWAGGV